MNFPSTPRAITGTLTTTSQTTIFTSVSGLEIVTGLHVSNTTSSAATITVEVTAAGTAAKLAYQWSVQPNTTGLHMDREDGFGYQMAIGDTVKLTAGTGNALDYVLYLIEVAGRAS